MAAVGRSNEHTDTGGGKPERWQAASRGMGTLQSEGRLEQVGKSNRRSVGESDRGNNQRWRGRPMPLLPVS